MGGGSSICKGSAVGSAVDGGSAVDKGFFDGEGSALA